MEQAPNKMKRTRLLALLGLGMLLAAGGAAAAQLGSGTHDGLDARADAPETPAEINMLDPDEAARGAIDEVEEAGHQAISQGAGAARAAYNDSRDAADRAQEQAGAAVDRAKERVEKARELVKEQEEWITATAETAVEHARETACEGTVWVLDGARAAVRDAGSAVGPARAASGAGGPSDPCLAL